jgi:hypothetical protein
VYEGKYKGEVDPEYDVYGLLAERYHWLPVQVDRLDPNYIDYLCAKLAAESDYQEAERKKQERERKRQERQGKGSRKGEDVDI